MLLFFLDLLDILDSAAYDFDFTSVLLFVRRLKISTSSSVSLALGRRGTSERLLFFFLLFALLFRLLGLLLLLCLLLLLLAVDLVEEGGKVRWLLTHI